MRALLWVGGALLCGCPTPEDTGVDCETAPTVTYESFGRGFLTQHCQPCHATTSPDRNEAPDAIHFDTLADVRALQVDMRFAATGPQPYMPPEGGVSELDRELLAIWLDCGVDLEAE